MDKPIKRHTALIPLSKAHHWGLLFCWKNRQGIRLQVSPDRITRYVIYFWKQLLNEHFKDEEEQLFTDRNDIMVQKALTGHKEIADMVTLIHKSSADYTILTLLADTMDDHIRYEERVLFPHLEKTLGAAYLNTIEANLHDKELKDNYPEEFWVK